MTIARIKDIFNEVSLQHIDIQQFYFGDSFDVAVSPNTQYPIVFLEMPYMINYNDNRRSKTYQFALMVLFKIPQDDLVASHTAISKTEDIGDAILSKIQNEYKTEIALSGIRALSLDQFSDDYTAGVRYELTITINRDYTLPVCYETQFDAEC